MLDRYAEPDPRIRLVHRAENGHICAASNSALELATGDFCALLDHDDLLAEHALVHVVEAIGAQPEAAFFYSDEDKLSSNGARITPHFKPALILICCSLRTISLTFWLQRRRRSRR